MCKETGGAWGVVPTAQLWGLSPLHSGESGLRAATRAGDSPVEGRGSRGRIHLSAVFQARSSIAQALGPGAPPPGEWLQMRGGGGGLALFPIFTFADSQPEKPAQPG